jgi:Carboxypeptidase regulatory-like domain
MRALSCIAAILLFLLALPLQAAAPGVSASGRIVGADGRPVAGAWVALVRSEASLRDPKEPDPNSARTGPDGRFTLTGVPPGVYVLHAAHPEHPRFYQPGIDIPEGKRKIDIGGFALSKPQRVEGQVVDQEGRPVEGVRIVQSLSGRLEIAAAPVTGPDGRFVLPELIVGNLTLCKEGYDSSRGPLAYPSLFSKPARIVLWPARPLLRVTGRVVDDEGRPVAGARVSSGPHENGCTVVNLIDPCTGKLIPDEFATSGADGRFSMEVRARVELDVTAEAPGHLPAVQSRVPAAPEQSAGIELVLRRSVTVTGRVLAKDGSPAAGARIALFANPRSPEAVSDAQGRFRLEGIAPGRQLFQAEHPKLGRALRRLEVAPGAGSLEFRLDGAPEQRQAVRPEIPTGSVTSLTGRLLGVDAEHVATGIVEAQKGEESRRTEVTREGRYRLRDLSPGEWTVTASVVGGRSAATRVLLEPGQEEALLDLEIARDVEIRGRVLAPDGTPAAIAAVRFNRSDAPGSIMVPADGDGRFATKVSPGTYSLLATDARYGPSRLESFTVTEPLDGLEIRLRPGLTLTGRILDLPAGTQVSIYARQDGATQMTQAGPDGTYRFDNLGPGEWELTASVHMKDFYRDGRGSVVLSPETAGRFDFDLALGSASLSGTLGTDDNPIIAGIELLMPEGDKIAATGAGLDGEFRFPHLRPGSYILRITDRFSGRVLTRAVEISGDEEIGIETLE